MDEKTIAAAVPHKPPFCHAEKGRRGEKNAITPALQYSKDHTPGSD